jgi:phage tail sheath gpL-like
VDVRVNYQDGEKTPAGLTVAVVAMASGATNPVLTTLIAALGDNWFHIIAHPYTDATSLTAIEAEMASRFGPMRMIDGLAITSAVGTQATLGTLGDTRNSPHSCIVAQPGKNPLTPPCEFAAAVAAVVAYYAQQDPARPLQTLPVDGVKPPVETDRFTVQERNLELFDGISTTKVAGSQVQIDRLITTSQTNAAGAADTAYLDATSMLTLQYLRYSFRTRVAARYPRHKLASDGTRFGAGQAVVTPKLMRAEAVTWFSEMEELGLVEGKDQFKRDLVVERSTTDANRIDVLLPPDLINQLVVTAASIQFRL